MSVARKIAALIEGLEMADVEQMPPVERDRLAQRFRHWADRIEQSKRRPRPVGIFAEILNDRCTD
jgi:hypothetical protein